MKKIFTSFIAVFLTTICAVAQLPYNTIMTQDHFNTSSTKIASSGDNAWDGGVRLGGSSTSIWGTDKPAYNWNDKYIIIALSPDGIPNRITCSTSTNSNSTSDTKFYIATSTNNSTYTEKWSSESRSNTIDLELAKDVKYIKLCYSGNFAGYFKNIKVSELIEVKDPAKKTLDAGSSEINTENTTISTTMEWCNTPAFNLSIDGEDDSQFTASISNNASKGKYGTATIYVTYKHNILGTHNAELTISNGAYTKKITLKGTTTKKTPYLLWKQDLLEKLPLNEVVTDAAYSPNGQDLPIIYSSSNEEVLKVNGNSFTAVGEGTATITASTEETDEYKAATPVTKTFTVTVKKIQSIVWLDNLTRLKIGDQPDTLTAIVQLVDSTGNKYDAPERTALLTYTSADNNVVSVSGNVLTIVGEGETTLTAEVPGDDEQEIEPASVTIPVKVRQQLSSGCEDEILLNNNSEYEFYKFDTGKPQLISGTYTINTSLGVPGLLTFQYKGEKYWTGNYNGTIKAQQSTNGGSTWTDIAGSEVTPTVGTYQTHTVSLDRKATHIRFVRPQGGEGYHYVKGILVTPAQYIETDINSISENSIVGATILKNININYSNVKGEVTIAKSHPNVLISAEYLEDVECGDFGTRTLQVGIIPTEFGTINDEIVISDAVSGKKAIIPITINVSRDNQTIVWEQTTDIKTTDAITLTAEAKTNIIYTSSNTEVADIEDNKLVIKTAGTVTITANAEETNKYKAATAQKTFNISKATPAVISLPTVDPITYGATLEAATLNGGETDTEGTWQWNADLTQVLNAGTHTLNIQFVPTNTAWYNTLNTTIDVTVNKAAQTITWDFTTTEMTVDDVLTLNANATAGEVTFALTGDAATLAGNTLTAVKAGEVTITASQAGNDNYNAAEEVAHTITIHKATPTVTAWPTLNDVVYGATYGEALQLVGGEASVEGAFSITNMPADLAQVPTVGEYTYGIVFTPAKSESYNEVSDSITLKVTKNLQTITWDFADQELLIGNTLNLSAIAPAGEVTFAIEPVEGIAMLEGNTLTALAAGTVTITATAPENENYEAATISHIVTVIKHTPEITTLPTVDPIGYDTPLTNDLLMDGETTTEGTWEFVNPDQELQMGDNEVVIRFVPNNAEHYSPIEITIIITVEKATTTISWEKINSDDLYIGGYLGLDAEASSGVEISYTVTAPEGVLEYDSDLGVYFIIGYGTITITAHAEETETHKAAEMTQEVTIYDPDSNPSTNITNTTINGEKAQKIFVNGKLYIIRNNQWYDTIGKLVQ